MDKDRLYKLGYTQIVQCNVQSKRADASNSQIMEYLKGVVPKMFQVKKYLFSLLFTFTISSPRYLRFHIFFRILCPIWRRTWFSSFWTSWHLERVSVSILFFASKTWSSVWRHRYIVKTRTAFSLSVYDQLFKTFFLLFVNVNKSKIFLAHNGISVTHLCIFMYETLFFLLL